METFWRLRERDEGRRLIEVRGQDNVVIGMDILLDRELRGIVEDLGVPVRYLSEDSDEVTIGGSDPEYLLLADPLDGSRNFYRGIPFYGFSIALAKPYASLSKDLLAGAVGDFERKELHVYAIESRPRIPKGKNNGKLLVSLYDYGLGANVEGLKIRTETACRTLGAVALEISYVALGKLDAVVEMRGLGRAVDIAGAYPHLIVKGGKLTDLFGGDLIFKLDTEPRLSFIAARDRRVIERILNVMSEGG